MPSAHERSGEQSIEGYCPLVWKNQPESTPTSLNLVLHLFLDRFATLAFPVECAWWHLDNLPIHTRYGSTSHTPEHYLPLCVPQELVVKFQLPLIASAAAVDLDVTRTKASDGNMFGMDRHTFAPPTTSM